jgi:DNA-binding CsgD family transcriptional regulator
MGNSDETLMRTGNFKARLRFVVSVTLLQVVAAAFFVADSLVDTQLPPAQLPSDMSWLEAGIAAALFVGVLLGALQTRRLFIEADERERVITVARGAVAEVIAQRFAEWGLTAAESDVALFALKGCTIAEIARMRGSAEGTVRAQLSQVYAKAGVSSPALLMATFFDELIDSPRA